MKTVSIKVIYFWKVCYLHCFMTVLSATHNTCTSQICTSTMLLLIAGS